jgi:DNA-binding NarL/FixJ family response regulator
MASVLVVDEHFELGEIIVEFLRHKGYQVHVARSGEAAIETLNSTPFDLVIADLQLSGKLLVSMSFFIIKHRLQRDLVFFSPLYQPAPFHKSIATPSVGFLPEYRWSRMTRESGLLLI